MIADDGYTDPDKAVIACDAPPGYAAAGDHKQDQCGYGSVSGQTMGSELVAVLTLAARRKRRAA